MLEFAKNDYENVVYINFKENETAKKVFDGDLIVDRMTIDLSALIPSVNFVANKTLIIFDEIQGCANARTSLKPFVVDGRYDVLATGSLLEIKGYNLKKEKVFQLAMKKLFIWNLRTLRNSYGQEASMKVPLTYLKNHIKIWAR